jgi:hypothetical protein
MLDLCLCQMAGTKTYSSRGLYPRQSASTMPPPDDTPSYHLLVHPRSLFVFQLGTTTPIPPSLLQPLSPATQSSDGKMAFRSITWTHDEISIVTDVPPSTFPEFKAGTDQWLVLSGPADWECVALSIRGPMELSMCIHAIYTRRDQRRFTALTGILCSLITPLKTAGIPIFTLATWCVHSNSRQHGSIEV